MNDLTNLSTIAKLMLTDIRDHSNNALCASRAAMYLHPEDLHQAQLIANTEGSFMRAVLAGDLDGAYALADLDNKKALETINSLLTLS